MTREDHKYRTVSYGADDWSSLIFDQKVHLSPRFAVFAAPAMQDFLGSVRRSLVFKPSGEESAGFGGFVEKIGSSIRRSRIGIFERPPVHALPPIATPPRGVVKAVPPVEEESPLPPMEVSVEDDLVVVRDLDEAVTTPKTVKDEQLKKKEAALPAPIRWRKGELIGCGAFGRVHMGMNLDSGELLAVKEVSIAVNSTSKKTQEYIMELEKEVNLLKNLSHPNIVRYLGTARENDSLNILLEFVPGGSISSLLGKFGSFPESVIKMYTKQLLLGLEYLHKNKIMHRDIKGANILVDNKGCIKLADFGASKKVEALATINGAKSMKGTPYWMAPEVIVQSGHSFSADIWSVGCTVIEMATGKAPWSQQYQEVAALFYVGTTKSHPPIPDHLSDKAKDFLLKCLQKEPDLRPTASDLLKHPFVTQETRESHRLLRSSLLDSSGKRSSVLGVETKKSFSTTSPEQFSAQGSLWAPVNFDDDDDMCRIDDNDDLVTGASMKFSHHLLSRDCNQSYNPMSEPNDDWACKFDGSPEMIKSGIMHGDRSLGSGEVNCGFTFPVGQSGSEDDDEETESKIRAFLDEKALELKRLQTPLYEFYNSLNVASPPSPVGIGNKENISSNCNLPPKSSRSPNRLGSRRLSTAPDIEYASSPGRCSRRVSNIGDVNCQASQDVRELLIDSHIEPLTPSSRLSESEKKKWKEELDEELERTRELIRQAGGAKTSSPKDRILNRKRDRLRFASPGK
ncbi:mitogen-activated protein kinase kinase kinase NPK1-like isoform X2 [Andrographis paniculata]|uniref:mitogen-activated protein kinase kinase kinase NPK1-like isoform X2 n=1 Tax=Andrographis paniculata TaxID=175694 RepID=UPI0021E93824|nr:mitogen-activated protein kinase kinase kinase NPK1-like isoform X2 [Andrographis paniculata]